MMPTGRIREQRSLPAGERGFTLVEVMVALVLLSMVLLAGGAFMIRSMSSSSAMVGRQGAVDVANQQLEKVRAISATLDAAGRSPLVYGRARADVTAQWTAAAAVGLSSAGTYTGSGATTFDAATYDTAGNALSVPLSQIMTPGSQPYTVATLIGTCVVPALGSSCGRSALGTQLFRVVVLVTWTPRTGSCSGKACSYSVSALVDPSRDPVFNTSRSPVANPDSATVASGQSTSIGVTLNDSGTFALSGAITIISQPTGGSATVSSSSNIVTYTATAGFSGTDTFTYSATDTAGRVSNVATVTITVTPVGAADTASTTTGAAAFSTAVLGNDLGTGLSLVSITAPAIGTATISGTGIRYTPPAAASGIAAITYTAKDAANQTYTSTLTITVKPKVVDPGCFNILSLNVFSFTPLITGTGPYTITVTSVTGASVPPNILSGSLSGLYIGEKVTFTVTDGNGVVSDVQTVTVALRIC